MEVIAVVALALSLDALFGEPRYHHPLVLFASFAEIIESKLNNGKGNKALGVIALIIVVVPPLAMVHVVGLWWRDTTLLGILWSASIVYLAIGWNSLIQHAQSVSIPLSNGDLEAARNSVSDLVSRDTHSMAEDAVAKGAIESILENGADAVFSVLFWFMVLGLPGVVLYRLVNTLDAMWGYKNDRFLEFGWFAARLDDLLNLVPAQLTALSYCLFGRRQQALHCWRHQGLIWKSLNAGSVMAAGAGSINVTVGGDDSYHGTMQARPLLGPQPSEETRPSVAGIQSACLLVNKALALWGLAIILVVMASLK